MHAEYAADDPSPAPTGREERAVKFSDGLRVTIRSFSMTSA